MTEKEIKKPDYSKMNIYQKLVEVKRHVRGLAKNQKSGKDGDSFSYGYITPSKVYSTINEHINEIGVYLQVAITDHEIVEYETVSSRGKQLITNLYNISFLMTWVNIDNTDEKIELPWFAGGVNGVEKGLGSAITYGTRYFLQTQFLIANDKDDVDDLPHIEIEKKAKEELENKEELEKLEIIMDGIDGYLIAIETLESLEKYKSKLRVDLKGLPKDFTNKVLTKLTTHEDLLKEAG